MRTLKFFSPDYMMLKFFAPASMTVAQKMVQIQADIDMAWIACQLEIFHRQTGHYPENLKDLKQSLPHDIISGNPYLYSLTPNGKYRLWSVGWDRKDDSGKVLYKDSGKNQVDRFHGDWLWQYPDKTPAS